MPEPLLFKTASGRTEAASACLDQYGGLVWTLARRMTDSREAAEEAVQSVFAELWKNVSKYDARLVSETAFVAMLARKHLVALRRAAKQAPAWRPLDHTAESDTHETHEAPGMSDEAERAVAAMRKLRPEEREVLKLFIFEALSYEEIADKTEMPLDAVKTHARRGLIRIQQVLGSNAAVPVLEAVS